MKLTCSGSKHSPTYYIQKTIRIGDKTKTKTIERLGTLDEISKRCGNADPLEWAKEYTRQLTLAEKEDEQAFLIKFSASAPINKNVRHTCNVGYLFLQDIYHSLGMNDICSHISRKHMFNHDLNAILSMLICSRIIFLDSKCSSLTDSQSFLEQPDCNIYHIYKALKTISKGNDYIQTELYKHFDASGALDKNVLFYDCTNFCFEFADEMIFKKQHASVEQPPYELFQIGLFTDANGLPLSLSIYNANEKKPAQMTLLEQKIAKNFSSAELIAYTDSGFSGATNQKFSNFQGIGYITSQPIKNLKGFLQEFCLSDSGWHLANSGNFYRLSTLDEITDYENVFYKDFWITKNNRKQHLIVTYSLKRHNYQQAIRERQVKRAKLDEEAKYDGFYAVCTNLERPISDIIEMIQRRWEVEECFRIIKSEFKPHSSYLSRKDCITAHFTICFLALTICRILEKKLNNIYRQEEIANVLKTMNMLIAPGEGYIPAYTRTDLTDALHDTFGFRTDYQIISQKNMRKILNRNKKKGNNKEQKPNTTSE